LSFGPTGGSPPKTASGAPEKGEPVCGGALRISGAGEAAGICCTTPQAGHLACRPAVSSATRKSFPHWRQRNSMGN
jgi:hypothetical protein